MAGPEMSLMVDEYESLLRNKDEDDSSKHHEDTLAFEKKFKKDVKAFADILEGEGNPFEEEEDILITLMSKTVMDIESARSVKIARDAGATQYREFKVERLITGKTSVHEPIKRNKFSLFRNKNSIKTSSSKLKLTSMKQDCQLFSRLYVVCQSRESDLSEFFAHENHVYPPALSMYGKLRQTAKSDCLKIFDEYIIVQTERPSDITAVLLDGAAIVHMVSPLSSRNFQDYADNEMASFFKTILANRDLRRLDLVFDVYRESSIKEGAREKWGTGSRIKVTAKTPIPKNWKNFLRVDANKSELFKILAMCVVKLNVPEKIIVSTIMDQVLTNGFDGIVDDLSPCNHEEADTRLFLHVKHCSQEGNSKVLTKTVDTDVVIIAIAKFTFLALDELWIEFGAGKNRRWIPIHRIVEALGEEKCSALLYWHAFTGCDTVSSFAGKEKTSAWQCWKAYPGATETLQRLSDSPETISEGDLTQLQRFVILMYDRSSSRTDVNDCRRHLFTKKSRPIDVIPSTKDALHQHSLRAAYQAGYVWGQSCEKVQALPDPTFWGWKKIDGKDNLRCVTLCLDPSYLKCNDSSSYCLWTCVKSALISLLDSNVGTYGHLVADVVEAMQETAMPLIEPSGTVEVIAQMLDIHPAEMQDVDVEDALERLTTRLEEGENRR
eukprot:gene21193-23274_t